MTAWGVGQRRNRGWAVGAATTTPGPVPKGQTFGSLALDAYASVVAPPVPLGAVASGSMGMLSAALEVKGALDGGSNAVVGAALQFVEKVGAEISSGVLDVVVTEVTAALPDLGGALANIGGAIPIIGAAVSVVSGAVGMVNDKIAKDISDSEILERSLFRPIRGSWSGGKVVPADYLWDGHGGMGDDSKVLQDSSGWPAGPTSIGSMIGLMTWVRSPHFNRMNEMIHAGYGYAHQEDVGLKVRDLMWPFESAASYIVTKEEQKYLLKLARAIGSMSGRYETDGGFSLWPSLIDFLYSIRERNRGLFDHWLAALQEFGWMTGAGDQRDPYAPTSPADISFSGSFGGAYSYDPRPQHAVVALIEDWGQTVDFYDVRGGAPLAGVMRAITLKAAGKNPTHIKLSFSKEQVAALRAASRMKVSGGGAKLALGGLVLGGLTKALGWW